MQKETLREREREKKKEREIEREKEKERKREEKKKGERVKLEFLAPVPKMGGWPWAFLILRVKGRQKTFHCGKTMQNC